jgi:hypothetical protein
MNIITQDEFKLQLQRDDKQHHKNQEISDIFRIVVDTVTDILYRFLDYLGIATRDNIINMSILDEIDTIIDYANECLADVSHTYSSSRLILDKKIELYRGKRATAFIQTTSIDNHA